MDQANIVKRLISSAVILTITSLVIFKGSLLVFIFFLEIFSLLALYEFYVMAEKKSLKPDKWFGLGCGAAVALFYSYPGEAIVIAASIVALLLIRFRAQNELQSSALVTVAVTLFGVLYISWFFSFLVKIRCLEFGPRWVAYLILVTKMGDAGAYFIGTKFGKKKLVPSISPNKTVEGAIGGLATAVLLSCLSITYLPGVTFVQLFYLGILLGVFAQVGDLAESLIKRDMGVKDSGVIPGLGGMLDVLDSILFTAPLLYYFLTRVVTG